MFSGQILLENFILIEMIGHGQSKLVWMAKDILSGELVALKFYSKKLKDHEFK